LGVGDDNFGTEGERELADTIGPKNQIMFASSTLVVGSGKRTLQNGKGGGKIEGGRSSKWAIGGAVFMERQISSHRSEERKPEEWHASA